MAQALNNYSTQLILTYNRAVSNDYRVLLKGATLRPLPSTSTMTVDQARFAESQVGGLRDGFADSGLSIRQATVKATVQSYTMVGQDVAVTADMTTTVTSINASDGTPFTSSWSDTRAITFAPTRSRAGIDYSVVTDRAVPPPSNQGGLSVSQMASLGITARPSSDDKRAASTTQSPTPPTSSALAQPRINVTSFVNYAWYWTYTRATMNPAYPILGADCANFASQVLDHAGFNPVGGSYAQKWSTSIWTYSLGWPGGPSNTWSVASYQYTYVYRNSGQYTWLSNIWNATPGDLLYTDWDPNLRPDGTIDHVMVVTGRNNVAGSNSPTGQAFVSPFISQKTPNRYNIPLQVSINYARGEGRTVVWYGLKHS